MYEYVAIKAFIAQLGNESRLRDDKLRFSLLLFWIITFFMPLLWYLMFLIFTITVKEKDKCPLFFEFISENITVKWFIGILFVLGIVALFITSALTFRSKKYKERFNYDKIRRMSLISFVLHDYYLNNEKKKNDSINNAEKVNYQKERKEYRTDLFVGTFNENKNESYHDLMKKNTELKNKISNLDSDKVKYLINKLEEDLIKLEEEQKKDTTLAYNLALATSGLTLIYNLVSSVSWWLASKLPENKNSGNLSQVWELLKKSYENSLISDELLKSSILVIASFASFAVFGFVMYIKKERQINFQSKNSFLIQNTRYTIDALKELSEEYAAATKNVNMTR